MNVARYVGQRLLALVPTVLAIITLCFFLLQLMPGGPVERALQRVRAGGAGVDVNEAELTRDLNAQYGFDQPLPVRYARWLGRLAHLDFGTSLLYQRPVWDVIRERFPVSMQFGLASLLLMYTVSVTLGVLMARRVDGPVDRWVGLGLVIIAAVPPFALAVLALALFAGGHFFDWFPLGYLTSDDYATRDLWGRIADRAHHFALPLFCYVVGGFASLTYLSRNSMLEQLGSDYVRVARSKGLTEQRVLIKHVLRNALLPIVTGIGGYLALFLSGSLLIERIFQLDGIGSLGFRALAGRDYNLVMGLLVLQSAALLVGNLVSDLIYLAVDPRLDFAAGGV